MKDCAGWLFRDILRGRGYMKGKCLQCGGEVGGIDNGYWKYKCYECGFRWDGELMIEGRWYLGAYGLRGSGNWKLVPGGCLGIFNGEEV
jgi:hypothetical protein